MGREKIKIAYIQEGAKRRNTLKKRMKGLMKKIMELNILCGTKFFRLSAPRQVWRSRLQR